MQAHICLNIMTACLCACVCVRMNTTLCLFARILRVHSENLAASEKSRHELFKNFRVLGLSIWPVHGAHTVRARARDHVVGILHEFIQFAKSLLTYPIKICHEESSTLACRNEEVLTKPILLVRSKQSLWIIAETRTSHI